MLKLNAELKDFVLQYVAFFEDLIRVKRSYGVSATAVLFQILVINLLSIGANVVLQAMHTSRVQAENPDVSAEELKALVSEAIGQQAVLTTFISLAAAGLALATAIFVAYKMLRTFRFRDSLNTKTRAKAYQQYENIFIKNPIKITYLPTTKTPCYK